MTVLDGGAGDAGRRPRGPALGACGLSGAPRGEWGVHHRPGHHARSRRHGGRCRPRARRGTACAPGEPGGGGPPSAVGAWLDHHEPRRASLRLDGAAPPGMAGQRGGPRPGQALVILAQPRLGRTEVVREEDGHAQARRGSAPGLSRVRAGDVWSADRTVCPRGLLGGLARRGAACLVRQHGQVPGERLGAPTRPGVPRSGPVEAHALLVPDPVSGAPLPVRRLTLARQTAPRAGDTAWPLRTHSPAQEARARLLVEGDGTRGTIATACVARTTPRSCAMRTCGSPTAAWWACGLA